MRLVVLANGLNTGLRHSLGIEREVVSACHSISIGFALEPAGRSSFDFKGSVERGEGKNPGDDAYFVLKGTLTESLTDENKKVTSKDREVVLKMFPQDAAPSTEVRN